MRDDVCVRRIKLTCFHSMLAHSITKFSIAWLGNMNSFEQTQMLEDDSHAELRYIALRDR